MNAHNIKSLLHCCINSLREFSLLPDEILLHNIKKLVSLLVCYFVSVNSFAVTVNSSKSYTGNVSFITVGNTNHRLEDGVVPRDNIVDRFVENGDIEPINEENTLFSAPTENCNYSVFAIDLPKEVTCEDTIEILHASLFWGGRHDSPQTETVRILVTDYDGNQLPDIAETVISAPSNDVKLNGSSRGIYSCHADVTDYIKRAVNAASDDNFLYRFYVADLNTSFVEVGSGDQIGKFSGWTLTIVYKHKGLPQRSIFLYQPDLMADISSTESGEGQSRSALFVELGLDSNFALLKEQEISFVSTFLGAYRTEEDDKIIANGNNRQSFERNQALFSHESEGLIEIGGTETKYFVENNCFNNSISYEYELEHATVKSPNIYTRGYDLNAISSDLQSCLDTTNKSFNIGVKLLPEVHFFTDAVLMFGQPDIPGVVAQDSSSKEVKPDETFKYSLFVGLHQNTEQLSGMTINIPLTEYVDYVEDIQIKLVDSLPDRTKIDKLVDSLSLSLSYGGTKYDICSDDFKQRFKWSYSSDLNPDLNPKLRDAMFITDSLNYQAFLSNPLTVKQRVLSFSFDTVYPIGVDDDKAIEIELTLHSKAATDWAYQKNFLAANRKIPMLEQGEVVFNTPSNRKSVLQSLGIPNEYNEGGSFDWSSYICKQKKRGEGSGDGGADGSGGGDEDGDCEKSAYTGESAKKKGVFTKDTVHISIEVVPDGAFCPLFTLPRELEFSFCRDTKVSAMALKNLLKSKYKADIDSLARRDSLIWLETKQAMVYDYMKRYGVSRSEMEGLINFDDVEGTIRKIIETGTCGDENAPVTDKDLDSIMKMKIEYSDIFLFYNSASEGDVYETDSVSLRGAGRENRTWTFDESMDLYLYYKSPWLEGGCSEFVPVKIRPFDNETPIVQYGGVTLPQDTTIRICLDSQLDTFRIIKQSASHDVYAVIEGEREALNVDPVREFLWLPSEDELSTAVGGEKHFMIYSRDLDCVSDTLSFSVVVSETKITEAPEIKRIEGEREERGLTLLDICKSRNSLDSLTLEITNPIEGYSAVWTAKNDTAAIILGKGEAVNVPADKVGAVWYSVVFSNDECVGDKKDEIRVNILPLPDTLKPDTLTICYDYALTEGDLQEAVADKYTGSKVKGIYFFENLVKAENTASVTADVIANALNRDTLNAGNSYYYVRVEDKNKCYSVPTKNVVVRNEFDRSEPKFPVDAKGVLVDSALVCLGAKPKENLNDYLSEEEIAENSSINQQPKYYWVHSLNSLPKYEPNSILYKNTKPSYSSLLDGTAAGHDTMYVVRVDSNSCVSKPKQFRLHVDSNITTLPFVDDPTIPRTGLKQLDLNFCQYEAKYKSGYIPAWGTEPGYEIEWYRVDSLSQFVEDTVVTIPYAEISFDYPDTLFFKVRQSTALGCHGKWLPVRAMIHPAVTQIPEIDLIELCYGENPVEVEVKNKPTTKGLSTFFVEKEKEIVVENYLTKFTVKADSVIPESDPPFVNGYAIFKNSITGCKSDSAPILSRIHDLPKKPISSYKERNFCLESGEIDLTQLFDVKTMAEDPNYNSNILVWSSALNREPKVSAEGILSSERALRDFALSVLQTDGVTGCKGDTINLTLSVDSTFSFEHFDTTLCYGLTMNLSQEVEKHISTNRDAFVTPSVEFEIYPLLGNTPALSPLAKDESVKSQYGRRESKVERYLVKVWDENSGCEVVDTLNLEFRALPKAETFASIDTCSMAEFILPNVTNRSEETYEWYRENGDLHSGESMTLGRSEKPYVILTDEYGCKDTATLTVTIHENPLKPIVKDLEICQHSGEVNLGVRENVDDSSVENSASKLNILIYKASYFEKGKETDAYINTNELDFSEPAMSLGYVVKQENILTTCFDTAHVNVLVRRKFTPEIKDYHAPCSQQEVNLAKYVNEYLAAERQKIGITNLSTISVSYADMRGSMSEADAGSIRRNAEKDSIKYSYTIADKDGVCSASDTLFVVINKIPLAPVIGDGGDSVFLCSASPLEVTAKPADRDAENLEVWWRVRGNEEKGNVYTLNSAVSELKISSFVKNAETGCESEESEVVCKVVEQVTAAELDSLILCAGEVMNVYDYLQKSFAYAPVSASRLGCRVWENGFPISRKELLSVKKREGTVVDYEIEMMDSLTGCTAKNTLRVVWKDAVKNRILAKNIACQGDEVLFSAVGETRPNTLKWIIEGEIVGTGTEYKISSLSEDVKVSLVTKLSGTECRDTVEHILRVYETPEKLEDVPTMRFCQAMESHDITLRHDEYETEWTNERGEVLVSEYYSVSATKDTAFSLEARLINQVQTNIVGMDTVCRSLPVVVPVEVVKHIDVVLRDTNICEPNTYNLMKEVGQPDKGLKVYSVSPEVEDSLAVSKSALYTITYEDRWHCKTSAQTDVRFISKPDSVLIAKNGFNICLGSETTIVPVLSAGNYAIEWTNSRDHKKSISDTLHIIADRVTVSPVQYEVVRVDTLYGCRGGITPFSYSVKEPISFSPITEQHLCEGETLNSDSLLTLIFGQNTLTLNYSLSPLSASHSQLVIKAEDKISTCKAEYSVEVRWHKNPKISLLGVRPACVGDTLVILSPSSDFYTYTKLSDNLTTKDSLLISSSVVGEQNILVSALSHSPVSADGKRCKTDTTIIISFAKTPAAFSMRMDTTICQGSMLPVPELNPEDGARVHWYSPMDGYTNEISRSELLPTDESGKYEYKVEQKLGVCSSVQPYIVEVEKEIEDEPLLRDTLYCTGEKPLLLKNADHNPRSSLYLTEWKDKDGTKVEASSCPLTAVAGTQEYTAVYMRGVCVGKETKMTLRVAEPEKDIEIYGDTALCRGNEISLSCTNLSSPEWQASDTTVRAETFRYVPSESGYVRVSGKDRNGCRAEKSVFVNLYDKPQPQILVRDTISHPFYQLSRDERTLSFEAQTSAERGATLVYSWELGDGNSYTAENFTHEYAYDFVEKMKPVVVRLEAWYEFDEQCKGEDLKVLRINPDFEVPNTMSGEDHFMPNYELQIFDRVGNLIFEGKDGWQGQDNDGREVFADTYFYAIVYYIDAKKHVRNGYITLVR